MFEYDACGRLIRQSNGISFIYDHDSLIGFKYNGSRYFYRKDPFGSIVAILDNTGNVVVKYAYNALGEFMPEGENIQLALLNLFKYRGYYYDPETIGGTNLFAYCNNNPVMNVDPTGCSPQWWQWVISGVELIAGIALCFVPGWQGIGATLIGTAVGSMINGYITEANGGTFSAGWWGGQAAGLMSAIPVVGTMLGTIVGSAITDYIDSGYNWNKIDWEKAIWSGAFAWGISIFPSIIGQLLGGLKIQNPFAYLMNAYNSIVAGVGNSIINVYWRGYNEK